MIVETLPEAVVEICKIHQPIQARAEQVEAAAVVPVLVLLVLLVLQTLAAVVVETNTTPQEQITLKVVLVLLRLDINLVM